MPDHSERTRGELIFYESPEGKVRVEVTHEDETFWLSQRQMAELFRVEVPTVIHHLKEVYGAGELDEEATTRKIRGVRTEGNRSVSREIVHSDLDAFISVGYRVNSVQATRFRIWATNTPREFSVVSSLQRRAFAQEARASSHRELKNLGVGPEGAGHHSPT